MERIKRALALVVAGLALVGLAIVATQAVEPPPELDGEPWVMPSALAVPGDSTNAQTIKSYLEANVPGWEATSAAPEPPPEINPAPPREGPPRCKQIYDWFVRCFDVNGEPFNIITLQLSDGAEHTFCENMQGEVYNCNGFAQP